ncbi:protein kinase [Streptomyces sp. NBRC 110028]|uniref:serine/threonine protein kinase n=1 Tax=Streptomyces sp. NBRC 110028 TaxID=1621260 RepID=UPI00131D8B58|nr:protein kinase [Streptomyces sp. NBRC 110028]
MTSTQERGAEERIGRPMSDSRPLSDELAWRGGLDPVRATRIGLQLLAVLDSAHRAGIVHGDISPARVLLRSDGEVVLSGFGHVGTEPSRQVTDPAYASPEQARGTGACAASDLWALGAVLFAMVEGRPPHRGRDSPEETLRIIREEPVPPPPHAGPLVPVIHGLLRDDPRERLTAPVVRHALERILTEGEPAAVHAAPRMPWLRNTYEAWFPSARRGGGRGDGRGDRHGDGRGGRRVGPLALAIATLVLGTAASVLALVTTSGLTGGDDRTSDTSPSAPLPSGGAPSLPRDDPPPSTPGDSAPPGSSAPGQPPPSSSAPPPAGSGGGSSPGPDDPPPSGYYRYTSDAGGFSIDLPKGWRQVKSGSRFHLKFTAEGDDRNLVVTFGRGPEQDPVDGWKRLIPTIEKLYPGFQRIDDIRRVDYRGWKAADMQWTTAVGKDHLRTFGRGFLVGDGRGFSIRWTTPADDWNAKENKQALGIFLGSFEQTKGSKVSKEGS